MQMDSAGRFSIPPYGIAIILKCYLQAINNKIFNDWVMLDFDSFSK